MLARNSTPSIFEVIGPGKGGQLEVLITWNERILQVCHYPIGPKVSVGINANINLPLGTLVRNFNLLEFKRGETFVHLPFEANNTILKTGFKHEQLKSEYYLLKQNEVVFISFANNIHLAVRFSPLLEKRVLNPPMLFSSAEYTAMLCALILTTLSGLIVSVKSPKTKKPEDPVIRIAGILFEKPPIRVETLEPIPVIEEEPVMLEPIEVKQIIPEQPKPEPVAVLPKRPMKIKKTKDQAIVKITKDDTAHAQSLEVDPTKMGLMSVLSSDGIRKKMDQAYNGAGELIGSGESATGSSGFNHNKSGFDLGQKLKNIGSGGESAATVGISQVKNKTVIQGHTVALGEREQTGIVVGGEESFSGTIDREAVRKAVRSHLPAIKYCFERQYKKNSNLQGKIVVAWEIHATGIAQKARVVSDASTMNNSVVENCVRSIIETIRFPEPPEGAVVEVTGFPFVFSGI